MVDAHMPAEGEDASKKNHDRKMSSDHESRQNLELPATASKNGELGFDWNCENRPIKKGLRYASQPLGNFFGSGGRIRTTDLRVMSPTSYLTAPPRGRSIIIAILPRKVK